MRSLPLVILATIATTALASDPAPIPAAATNFDRAIARAENLTLPINKVVLYREAATALIPTDKPRAVRLLKQALTDIDLAEADKKAHNALDDETLHLLEFYRLPVVMLMERIDPVEACAVLAPRQLADEDMTFQTLFFERLKHPETVREIALRKLDMGVTPAVIAAYGVLAKSSPDVARPLGAAIVLRLTKSDAATDTEAVHSAFLFTRVLRTDIGALAPEMIFNPRLLTPDQLRDLFSFIGDAFLASKDPEELILAQRPQLYLATLETYAPDKAQDVKLLPFALPDAKSKIMTPEGPVYDANHPDPATLTPEQSQQRAVLTAQVEAQVKESNAQIAHLAARAGQSGLSAKERDQAVFDAVEQANLALSLARRNPTALGREAFASGELEFYKLGEITHLVEHVSILLQNYALQNSAVADVAAQNLDGQEVQTQVQLAIAIREMTGVPPYLVPAEKPPAKTLPPPSTSAPPSLSPPSQVLQP